MTDKELLKQSSKCYPMRIRTRPLARPRIGFQTVAAAQIPYDHSVGTGSGSALWRLALVAPGFLHVFPRSLRDLAEAICCQITRKRVLSPGASSLVVLIGGERRCLDLIARGWIATGMACRWRGNNTSFFPQTQQVARLEGFCDNEWCPLHSRWRWQATRATAPGCRTVISCLSPSSHFNKGASGLWDARVNFISSRRQVGHYWVFCPTLIT